MTAEVRDAASLASCDLRIDRAGRRLDELRKQVADYEAANQPIARVDGANVNLVEWPDPPPPDIGVTAGEVVYNLRAALDYLVFGLAVLDSGVVNMKTQFPIVSSAASFKARRRPTKAGEPNWLTGLSDSHCAALERLQPYHGVNWTEFLREMSNEDKHRTIPVLAYIGGGMIQVGGSDEDAEALGGFKKTGDTSTYFPAPLVVTLSSEPPLPVIDALEILKREVASVVDSFRPDFSDE